MLLFLCKNIAEIGKMVLYSLDYFPSETVWHFNGGENTEKRQEKRKNVEVKHVTKPVTSVWAAGTCLSQAYRMNPQANLSNFDKLTY